VSVSALLAIASSLQVYVWREKWIFATTSMLDLSAGWRTFPPALRIATKVAA
jgi:hypothetical protein